MKFLEANRVIKSLANDAERQSIVLATSFQSEPFDIYLQAYFAHNNIRVTINHIPFGTFQQYIRNEHNEITVAILTPWDFLPELDWRIGYTLCVHGYDECLQTIHQNARLIARQVGAAVYVDTQGKPIFNQVKANQSIHAEIVHALNKYSIQHHIVSEFDLDLYLDSGQLCKGKDIADIARVLVTNYLQRPRSYKKVLVTDLDHTLWCGVIGEDGIEGIEYNAEGRGYKHYLYQSLLKTLKQRGVLLAVVSRNDEDLANAPFVENRMLLNALDMVTIAASYEAKSAQIENIAKQLNLALDSFVFVDDNPVELAEVNTALPGITCILFDTESEKFGKVLDEIQRLFPPASFSAEDEQRTAMYKTRIKSQPPSNSEGADITDFLCSLDMKLTIEERSLDDCQRAIQLLNKTNQFNINGRRLDEADVISLVAAGGRIFTASLEDKHGGHGEIITGIITDNCFKYFAMSCRVLKRNVEFAFIHQLCESLDLASIDIEYVETERNTPVKQFLDELFSHGELAVSQEQLFLKTAKYINLFSTKIKLIQP